MSEPNQTEVPTNANENAGVADPAPENTPVDGGIADPAPVDNGGIADPANGNPAPDLKVTDKPAEQPKPEDWKLDPIEGFNIPEANMNSFTSKAKELGLTKEQAAGMMGWHKEFNDSVVKASQAVQEQTLAAWHNEIAADKEFGGANWKTTLADSRKALDAFDTEGALRKMLIETQAQHNPAVIRAIARVGRAMGEHGFVNTNGEGPNANRIPLEDRLYPNMKTEY